MTRDEILAMEAGHELDALVAEEVMGWERRTYWVGSNHPEYHQEERQGLIGPEGLKRVDRMHLYSTDIAAAWEVVEKMEADNMGRLELVRLGWDWNRIWRATFFTTSLHEGAIAKADTAPLAICRAALLAVMDAD